VTSRLRSLERSLVRERAEIGVAQVVARYLRSWEQALSRGESPPDALYLVSTLIVTGFYLPTFHSALQYLAQCQRVASPPDRGALLRILLPPGRVSPRVGWS
jgi:hypothetical protein